MPRLGVAFGALLCFMPVAAWPAVDISVAKAAADPVERFPIRGFALEGHRSLTTDRLLAALKPWLGERQAADALLGARDAILAAYREAGYEMVSVELPSRIDLDGIVRLRVRETTIGRVTVSGNRNFSDHHFRNILPSLQEQNSPNLATLARELFMANDHTAYRVGLAFTPGAQGQADVELQVSDTTPIHFVLGADNAGSRAIGRTRATATLSHANLWGRGHEAVATYATALRAPSNVQQLALSYQVALPALGSRIQLGAAYSDADVGRVAEVFDINGQGVTVSLRLQRDLLRSDSTRHLVEVGIEDKRYRNTVDFFGTNLGVDVDARPFTINYLGSVRIAGASIAGTLGYTRNLSWGPRNDDATYAASRSGAQARWDAWRAKVQAQWPLESRWMWQGRLEAQTTRHPLISGEQFGLGGARSVRGFAEREASGDRGWQISNELLSPTIGSRHRVLAFVDAGRTHRLQRLAGEPADGVLASYGMGWRWTVDVSLTASLDLARVLRGTPLTPAGSHGVHFNASWRPF